MKTKKALLSVDDHIFDVSGLVQTIGALAAGEIKYRGCGIIIHRSNHIHGNAVIFLNYVSKDLIFGEWVDVYTTDTKWKHWDYAAFDMVANEHQQPLISRATDLLRKLHIVL